MPLFYHCALFSQEVYSYYVLYPMLYQTCVDNLVDNKSLAVDNPMPAMGKKITGRNYPNRILRPVYEFAYP